MRRALTAISRSAMPCRLTSCMGGSRQKLTTPDSCRVKPETALRRCGAGPETDQLKARILMLVYMLGRIATEADQHGVRAKVEDHR